MDGALGHPDADAAERLPLLGVGDRGRWRSKSDSARWARPRLADAAGIDAALRLRAGEAGEPPTPADAEVVVAEARSALRAAIG